MAPRLSGADFTFPLLDHPAALEVIRLIGLEGVDLGIFGDRSHLRPEVIRQDIPMWAGIVRERLERAGLVPADVFGMPGSEFTTMAVNHHDPTERAESEAFFADLLDFAVRIGCRHITLLPGVRFGDEPWSEAIERSAVALARRVEAGAERGVTVAVEAHLGSHVDTPERALELLDRTPGLTLTLDHCHFNFQGYPDEAVDPLVPFASHFQFRFSAPGRMQVRQQDNAIDFPRIVDAALRAGYEGFFGLEFVWMEIWDCDRVDNVSETIRLRDLVRAALAGAPGRPPES